MSAESTSWGGRFLQAVMLERQTQKLCCVLDVPCCSAIACSVPTNEVLPCKPRFCACVCLACIESHDIACVRVLDPCHILRILTQGGIPRDPQALSNGKFVRCLFCSTDQSSDNDRCDTCNKPVHDFKRWR